MARSARSRSAEMVSLGRFDHGARLAPISALEVAATDPLHQQAVIILRYLINAGNSALVILNDFDFAGR